MNVLTRGSPFMEAFMASVLFGAVTWACCCLLAAAWKRVFDGLVWIAKRF